MDDDLKGLSLEEKVALIAGKDFNRTTSIPRVGVPYLKVSDGPSGVRGMETGLEHFLGFPFHVSGKPPVTAAVYPCSTALAATWDRSLARSECYCCVILVCPALKRVYRGRKRHRARWKDKELRHDPGAHHQPHSGSTMRQVV